MKTNIYLTTQSKRALLLLIAAVHIAFLGVVLASSGTFISSRDRAPLFIVCLCILLSAYTAFRLAWLLIYNRGPAGNVFSAMKLSQLFPPVLFTVALDLLMSVLLMSDNGGI